MAMGSEPSSGWQEVGWRGSWGGHRGPRSSVGLRSKWDRKSLDGQKMGVA